MYTKNNRVRTGEEEGDDDDDIEDDSMHPILFDLNLYQTHSLYMYCSL